MIPKCCHIPCDKDAEFRIEDEGDKTSDGYTESCIAHVGHMLGSREGVKETGAWRVVAISLVPA